MKSSRIPFAVLVLLTTANLGHAQSIEEMIPNCSQAESYCSAYIEGVQTLMQANCQWGGPVELSIGWFPSNAAGRQAFLDWAERNPEKRREPFFSGMVSALIEAFPCSR